MEEFEHRKGQLKKTFPPPRVNRLAVSSLSMAVHEKWIKKEKETMQRSAKADSFRGQHVVHSAVFLLVPSFLFRTCKKT